MNPWDEEQLYERMESRARELGRPLSTLLRNAGFSEDLVRKKPSSGRRIDSLEKIATALKWTLGELLGIVKPGGQLAELSPARLRIALQLAERVLGTKPRLDDDRAEIISELTCEAYDAVVALERDRPGSATSEEALSVLETLLRRHLSRRGGPIR